jgi:hypothetical protein
MNTPSGIETRAMKFKLQRGGVSRSTRDKNAEQLVKQQLGDEGQTVSRKLFQNKNSPVYKYQQKSNDMYQFHIANTLPYGDDGTRLMKNSLYFEYTSKMQQFISELDSLKSTIVGDVAIYNKVVQDDIDERNAHLIAQGKQPTACVGDYISFEAMQDRLYIKWYPEPIATSGDFRFEIPDEMKRAYDANIQQMVVDAKQDIFARMVEPMKAFIVKMAIPIGADGAVFRDTMVTNLTDLVEHLPKLNVDDDPAVMNAVAELKAVTDKFKNPVVLRESQAAREQARLSVEELMGKLTGGWRI